MASPAATTTAEIAKPEPAVLADEKNHSPQSSLEDRKRHTDNATQLTDQSQRLPFARLIIAYISMATCFFVSFMDVNAATTALPKVMYNIQIPHDHALTNMTTEFDGTIFMRDTGHIL
jgi:hypothetical protein